MCLGDDFAAITSTLLQPLVVFMHSSIIRRVLLGLGLLQVPKPDSHLRTLEITILCDFGQWGLL